MPWSDASAGSATWSVLETHPYQLMTEDMLYYLTTETGAKIVIADDDGSFWAGVTTGTATWSAA